MRVSRFCHTSATLTLLIIRFDPIVAYMGSLAAFAALSGLVLRFNVDDVYSVVGLKCCCGCGWCRGPPSGSKLGSAEVSLDVADEKVFWWCWCCGPMAASLAFGFEVTRITFLWSGLVPPILLNFSMRVLVGLAGISLLGLCIGEELLWKISLFGGFDNHWWDLLLPAIATATLAVSILLLFRAIHPCVEHILIIVGADVFSGQTRRSGESVQAYDPRVRFDNCHLTSRTPWTIGATGRRPGNGFISRAVFPKRFIHLLPDDGCKTRRWIYYDHIVIKRSLRDSIPA